MHFGTMLPTPAWLSPDERKRYNKLKGAFLRDAKAREIPMDPFLALHIQDVVVCSLYLQRAESAWLAGEPEGQDPTAERNSTPVDAVAMAKLLDALAKHRERLRKAMKELDLYMNKAEERAKEGQPKNFLEYYAKLIEDAEKVVAETRPEKFNDEKYRGICTPLPPRKKNPPEEPQQAQAPDVVEGEAVAVSAPVESCTEEVRVEADSKVAQGEVDGGKDCAVLEDKEPERPMSLRAQSNAKLLASLKGRMYYPEKKVKNEPPGSVQAA